MVRRLALAWYTEASHVLAAKWMMGCLGVEARSRQQGQAASSSQPASGAWAAAAHTSLRRMASLQQACLLRS